MSGCHNPNYIGPKWSLFDDLIETIEALRNADDYQWKFLNELLKRVESLEEKIMTMKVVNETKSENEEKRFQVCVDRINNLVGRPTIPSKCPVCDGDGKRPNGREDGQINWDRCHSCYGKGVLWA